MCTSSRCAGGDLELGPLACLRRRCDQDEQGPQALAARRQRLARRAPDRIVRQLCGQPLLHRRQERQGARSREGAHVLRHRGHFTHLADVQGDDPAGQEPVADVAHAGAVEGLAELVGAREAAYRRGEVRVGPAAVEDLAEGRDAAVEPERVEALQRAVGRARDLEADDASARAHDASQLAQAAFGIGQVAEAEARSSRRRRSCRRTASPWRRRGPTGSPPRRRAASCGPRGAASRPRSRARSPGRCDRRRGPARARGRRCRSTRRAPWRRGRRRSRARRSRASGGRGRPS